MAHNIMIQGTASGVGKSLLAAGFCRVLRQDGCRVAPFKSQNMALNSYITDEGLEMGRAQVVQAEAAGITPSVDMNPILLKPQSDTGSQVIVNGEVRGVMGARDYYAYKKNLLPAVQAAYDRLAAQVDVVVIEGAGSPAEINLKRDDFVNMGLARMVNAPVLLAGDIDRGGVFASLYGTVALLTEAEQRLVKGVIVNKFRGDPTILEPGLAQLAELTGVPVIGTVPMLDVNLEEEDSQGLPNRTSGRGLLDVAVLRLPRISNFTDLHALEQVEGVEVRYVARTRELGAPDLVVLPGTKSTMDDLLWLRQVGLEAAVKKLAAAGTPVIGICGGYQMLGMTLTDPDSVERGGSLTGMELLPVDTVFQPGKARTRATGRVRVLPGGFAPLGGSVVEGYEIHMGRTVRRGGGVAFARLESGQEDGAAQGNVLGSYLHGLFDSPAFTGALLGLLLARKGLSPNALQAVDVAAYKETQYDKLADALRAHLDMERVYRIIGNCESHS